MHDHQATVVTLEPPATKGEHLPSPIDKAIDQLEKSVEKIREFSISESKAVQKAVRESSGSARSRVETDYAATRKRLLKEAKDAEKSIKEAIASIEKSLADSNPVKRASKPKAKKKPAAKKTATKAAAKPKAKKKPAAKKTATKAAAKPKAKKKPAAKK